MVYKKIAGTLLVVALLQGCATTDKTGQISQTEQTEKKLDEKLVQEPMSLKRQDVHREVTDWIKGSAALNADEKSKLLSLRESTDSQDSTLRAQSLKLRSVLIQDVLSGQYDAGEVSVVQQELQSVEHERLSVFFDAVRKANRILGRWGSRNERESEQFYDDMMREMGPPGMYF